MKTIKGKTLNKKELSITVQQLISTLWQLVDKIRAANSKMTKKRAIEYAAVMLAKIYLRSALDEMDKLQKQNEAVKLPIPEA